MFRTLNLDHVEINPGCKNVKYLRVQIDFQLTFNSYIRMVENKISRPLGIIIKLKSLFNPTALLKLYDALVHPHLLYGLLVWGTAYTSYSAKISTFQNKVVRHVDGDSYCQQSTPFYPNLKILKLPDFMKLEAAKLVFRHPVAYAEFWKGGGGGGRNFRKFEKNKDQNKKVFTQDWSDFLPKIR